MIRDLLKKALFLLLCVVGSANGAWAFTVSITDQASWNEAMEKLKTTTDAWNILNVDADVTLTENALFDKNTMSNNVSMVVLDLNGHKLNVGRIIIDGADRSKSTYFILKDNKYQAVTFDSKTTSVTNDNSGCLTLTNGITVKGEASFLFESGVIDGESSDHPVVCVIGDTTSAKSIISTAYINNGFIKGKEGCASVYGSGAKLYVDGTTQMQYNDDSLLGETDGTPVLTCLDNAPIAGNGTNNGSVNYGRTNITVGKSVVVGNITTAGYVACGIYHPQKGSLTIKDGAQIYANGGVGVLMRGGTLNMTGGDIEASGDKNLTGKVGDSRVVVPTSGIVFDDYAGYYDHSNVSVAVSDGTVTGSHSAVEVVKGETSTTPEKQIQLSGGTYSSDITMFVTEGKGSKKDNKEYTIADEVATVEFADGTVAHYAALQDACNATKDGSTLKLVTDLSVRGANFSNDNNKSVTFDLNGHTLRLTALSTVSGVISVSCNLTVKGGQIYNTYDLFYVYDNAHLILDGGTYTSTYQIAHYDNENCTSLIEFRNGKFNSNGALCYGSKTPNIKIYRGYYSQNYAMPNESISNYLADGCEKVTSDDSDYSIRVAMKPILLTYGEQAQEMEVNDNVVTIDMKDDATASERLGKIEIQAELPDANVTLQKNFATANVWNSFYVPFDITATSELLEKFDIAKIWDTELYWNDSTPETNIEFIQLNEGDKIAAFTPCLIRAKEAGKQDMTFNGVTLYKSATKSIDCSTVEQTFTFTGVLENTSIYGKYAVNANGQLVQATNTAAQVSPFKFYMAIDNKNGSTAQKAKAYRIRVIGDDTTGISDINATKTQQHDNTVYNLQGVAVGTTTEGLPSGIYIKNGRKVIVK